VRGLENRQHGEDEENRERAESQRWLHIRVRVRCDVYVVSCVASAAATLRSPTFWSIC
jgi:hypothetical protein